ncbi:protein kinase domain-containing protein [Glycomyces xiaoerkulensis]|uniref:protein kinase domain-containing protein n=1 Tax=Glycomyces xiaoerkulensis TaxID=2038139 RepID=UPI0012FFDA62|nr:protein kinase [Glycomyces xiaoerkulensis]
MAALSRAADEDGETAAALAAWNVRQWRTALLDIPLDEQGFLDRLQVERVNEIERLRQWWSDRERKATVNVKTAGYLGFYLLTLIAMHCSDRMRFHDAGAPNLETADIEPRGLCTELVADPAVRQAIGALYAPGRTGAKGSDSDSVLNARHQWSEVDLKSLGFHRFGTTSIILTGKTRTSLGTTKKRYALKCLIYPYQRISAITKATREYRDRYRLTEDDVQGTSHLVPVWASHDNWILMDFVEGATLAEVLEENAARAGPGPRRDLMRRIDLDELEQLGSALLVALGELERHGRRHGDLSPSNVIIERDGEAGSVRMRLIDLGVNHLYTRSLSGPHQGDAAYVAPEVRKAGKSGDEADLYSLGRLLIAISGVPPTADGTVPDQFYTDSVGLARLLEDLTDSRPERRLLVTEIRSSVRRFPEIKELYQHELEVAKTARSAERSGGRLNALKRLTPGEGMVNRQRQILEVRSKQVKGARGRFHLRRARWLSRWSVGSSWILWATFALVIMWWARDLGIDWQAKAVEALNNVLGRDREGIVVLDDVRASDYPIPDPWGNLPVRLIGLTFLLAGAKWYLNVLAGLTLRSQLRRRGRRRAITVATEVALRSAAFLPSVYIIVPTLVQRDWWPLFSALGVTTVAVVNSTCLMFARDAVGRARREGLSTVSDGEIATLEKFAPWMPSSWIYSFAVWSIGSLLMVGVLEDELVYAFAVALVNIGVFYITKCGIEAPYVRVGLSRAILAAERIDHLEAERAKAPRQRADDPDSGSAAPRADTRRAR